MIDKENEERLKRIVDEAWFNYTTTFKLYYNTWNPWVKYTAYKANNNYLKIYTKAATNYTEYLETLKV